MKKLLLGLGGLVAIVAPVATVVACGETKEQATTVLSFKTNETLLTSVSGNNSGAIDMVDEISDAIINDANKDTLTKSLDAVKNKNSKIKVSIEFGDSKVETDIQIKWANNKPVVTVNKVYIEKDSKEVTTSAAKLRINLFKAFARKYVLGLVEAQKTLNPSSTSAEIISAIKTQIGVAPSETDYYLSYSEADQKLVVVLDSDNVNIDSFASEVASTISAINIEKNTNVKNIQIESLVDKTLGKQTITTSSFTDKNEVINQIKANATLSKIIK